MARRPEGPWYRTARGAWYAKIGGRQVRLDTDHARATERFRAIMATAAGQGGPVTVLGLVELFLADAGRRVRPKTLELYRCHLGTLAELVGSLPAAEMLPKHITAWIVARGIGPNTAKVARAIVKACWRWAATEGHLETNPLARVVAGTVGRRREIEPADVARWVAAVTCPALRLWCDVGLATGMRPGEQAGLTWQDINAAARSAIVAGKRGRRPVYLSPEILSTLTRQGERWPDGPLLRTRRGMGWDVRWLGTRFRGHSKAVGIDLVPYDLRHEFASSLHRRGVDVLTISRLLGHASVTMAARHYIRHDPGPLLAALEIP